MDDALRVSPETKNAQPIRVTDWAWLLVFLVGWIPPPVSSNQMTLLHKTLLQRLKLLLPNRPKIVENVVAKIT